MYDLGDDDFANSYDAKKQAEKARTPRFPDHDLTCKTLLKRVLNTKSAKGKKMFVFRFTATASNSELIHVGGTYEQAFFPGADNVERERCWGNMLPILMAAVGATDVAKFDAPTVLGELLSISKGKPAAGNVAAVEGADIDAPIDITRVMEEARPDKKTGEYNPKVLDKNGKPKWYPRDQYHAGQAPAATAA